METKCCICGKEIVGGTHNAFPIRTDRGVDCCEDCNYHIVIPTRMGIWKTEDELQAKADEAYRLRYELASAAENIAQKDKRIRELRRMLDGALDRATQLKLEIEE